MSTGVLGVWTKGDLALTIAVDSDGVRVNPTIGDAFWVQEANWPTLQGRLRDGGWSHSESFSEDDEVTSRVEVRHSMEVTRELPRIQIPKDTVLRRRGGSIYLMTRQEGGWDSYAHRVVSEAWVLDRFNVRLGDWSTDQYGEFCPVTRVALRMVTRPPRPRKTG
jgi:hypothetical protein